MAQEKSTSKNWRPTKRLPTVVTLSLSKGLLPNTDFVLVRNSPRYSKVGLCY
jgi:hypothetical protein